jgi:AcrR family transcriptional regulator
MMDTKLSKRQSEIIQTAIKLIGEGGIQALTIKNLSSGIGISESAIYIHFNSKIEVIRILLDYLKSVITSNYNNVFQLKTSSFNRTGIPPTFGACLSGKRLINGVY